VAGALDTSMLLQGGQAGLDEMSSLLPDYRGDKLIPGCGHWNTQEAPDETNAALLEFLRSIED
jgi:pimeloyl-ACP methyl ester carboxylesterase